MHLLLVDDHADGAELLRMLLVRRGFAVTVACSVTAALAAAAAAQIDVLVSDIVLPDGTGYDLLHQLRARGSALPAVALSGLMRDADVQRGHDAGFAECLGKPVRIADLIDAVERASGRGGESGPV
jgi:two-component system CheB/CheR fusion protein